MSLVEQIDIAQMMAQMRAEHDGHPAPPPLLMGVSISWGG
jgi:hypothetical protein